MVGGGGRRPGEEGAKAGSGDLLGGAASQKDPTSQRTPAATSSSAGSATREEDNGISRSHGADWLPVSTGRGGRRLRRNQERKAAGVHFRSLWLAVLDRWFAPWPLLGFAVRDAGPEAEGGHRVCNPHDGRRVEEPLSSACPTPGRGPVSGRRLCVS